MHGNHLNQFNYYTSFKPKNKNVSSVRCMCFFYNDLGTRSPKIALNAFPISLLTVVVIHN